MKFEFDMAFPNEANSVTKDYHNKKSSTQSG